MAIKKFILSTGDGDSEESELDSYGNRTIGYDDVLQKIVISNAEIIGSLVVSGSITGSLSGSVIGGGMSTVYTSNNLTGSGKENDEVRLKDNISLVSVTSSFKGDGSQITGLTAAQVSGIISSVSSSGNLQGDGTNGSPIILKDNISLSSVTSSFSGDGSGLYNLPNETIFNSNEISGTLSLYDIVSIGSNGVTKCNKTDDKLSNVFGVVTKIIDSSYYISTSGRVTASLNSVYDRGTIVYAHTNGAASQYSELGSGDYVTQVGFVWSGSSGVGNKGVILLQPRIFGQLA